MKLLLALLSSLLLFASCDGGVIPRGKMSKIVAEIYLSDKYMSSSSIEMAEKADSILIYEPILNKYGYDTEDYLTTIAYYVERPSKLRTIYTNAQNILQKELDQTNIRLLAERSIDSLRNAISAELNSIKEGEIKDPLTRSLRWILFSEMEESWEKAAPDTSAVNYDSPVSPIWWEGNFRQKMKPFYLYENNRSAIPINPKLKSNPQGVREIGW